MASCSRGKENGGADGSSCVSTFHHLFLLAAGAVPGGALGIERFVLYSYIVKLKKKEKMRKSNLFGMLCLWGLLAGGLSSCTDENTTIIQQIVSPTTPGLSLTTMQTGDYVMELTDSITFKAALTGTEAVAFSWKLDTTEVSTDSVYTFKTDHSGFYTLTLTATDTATTANTYTQTANITVRGGKYKEGTFILNEGLVHTHGSLIYISPDGTLTPNVYFLENGEHLGDVCQDLYIHNNKMYIVSQNGGNGGGILTICNAETLKKERAYHSIGHGEDSLDWPTHIAVLSDDDIYLRDNRGVYLFHPSTEELIFVEGSDYARKNTMAVIGDKLYVTIDDMVAVIEKGKTEIAATIRTEDWISGLIKSKDGNLWVCDESGIIYKMDAQNYSIIEQHQLEGEAAQLLRVRSSQPAAPMITAKGDTLYISNTTTKIYRHIFSTNETTFMVDAKNCIPAPDADIVTVYNTCAVHPITGEVIINTLSGWAYGRHVNHITFLDFTNWKSDYQYPSVRDYANYTEYPANVFFTYNFE